MLRVSGHEISGSQRGFRSTPETLLSAKSNYKQGFKNYKSEREKNIKQIEIMLDICKTASFRASENGVIRNRHFPPYNLGYYSFQIIFYSYKIMYIINKVVLVNKIITI